MQKFYLTFFIFTRHGWPARTLLDYLELGCAPADLWLGNSTFEGKLSGGLGRLVALDREKRRPTVK